jgi:hypothetical protein
MIQQRTNPLEVLADLLAELEDAAARNLDVLSPVYYTNLELEYDRLYKDYLRHKKQNHA